MGFSSSQLVVLKKCSKSILYKLSSSEDHRRERRRLSIKKQGKCIETNATPDLAYECKKDQPQLTQSKHVSTEQHQKLKDANACAAAVETSTFTMQMSKTHSHRLSLSDPQASQSVPDVQINQSGNHGDLPPLKITHGNQQQQRHKKPTSTSTPVTPIQSTFNNSNDRFNLTYSKSSASSNSSSSCSEGEEAITPSTCTSAQWLSADDINYDKDAMITRRTKSQGNRTMMMLMMEAKPSPSCSSFFPITDHQGSATTKTTANKKADLDRSHSQISSSSSSLDSKSIFGKSEFRKKESKAIRMWHATVERLMMQRKMAITLEQHQQHQQHQRNQKIKGNTTEKDLAVARFIINELYYTEKSYYQFLLFIRSNYMEPMQAASRSKIPLVKPADVHVLFYHLPDLISMSEKLLGKLEIYANDVGGSPGIAIGQIFRDMEDDFAVFLKYAIHYQGHMKAIRRARNTGYAIKIDRESKTCRKENNRLELADYIIAPFQRVPRYELLLKDLLKHTHIPHQESTKTHDLVAAKNIISGLAATMNMVQEKISKSLFSSSFYSFNTQSSSNLLAVD
ncbi:hypothetical protein MAM1_0007d00836 [Mucor ambiguus]|uniref:DH domain-containing protein n=1 Tax=Mucor ambiguus TaxID=91626 RepID=A0A0C9MHF7_9FUNG|nr:hypothetical protein MAM1_0007d00836 [Mucor ambiguus]